MLKKILLIFFGIALALVFIEGIFRVSSFILGIYNNYKIKQNLDIKDKIIIACIGESMTKRQYPKFLDIMLRESGIKNVEVIDEGVSVDSNYLMNKLENKILKKYKPDIIIAMMGLKDEDDDLKKIRKIPSKIVSVFAFYKLFNINIFSNEDKETKTNNKDNQEKSKTFYPVDKKLDEKFKIAMKFFYDEKYNECLKILFALEYPSYVQGKVKCTIIDALKLSGRKKEFKDYVLKNLENYIMFQSKMFREETNINDLRDYIKSMLFLFHSMNFAEDTGFAVEILKKLFPIDNKELFKKITLNSLDRIGEIKSAMKQFELNDELRELNSIIEKIANDEIIFYNKKDSPFSKTAIENYKKLADLCEKNNIQLIVMQYPTLSVLPYKIYLKDYKNIIFVSNEENFKKALKEKKYFEIFIDSSCGEFGHCTDYGNELIAKNLTKVIKKII